MNSVDTGWVTDEDPFAKSIEKEDSHRFSPPLDSVDGAARVMDPIFTGYQTGRALLGANSSRTIARRAGSHVGRAR